MVISAALQETDGMVRLPTEVTQLLMSPSLSQSVLLSLVHDCCMCLAWDTVFGRRNLDR